MGADACGLQHCGSSVLVSASGELDEDAAETLQQALNSVTACERDLLVDLHGVAVMDSHGLLHLLDLHRRAEYLGLRVLVTGWQPQPQQLMAEPGPRPRARLGHRRAL